jgi:uncharacterized protein DUF6510
MNTENSHLDGNAAGGMLRDVFSREMTTALASCRGCGREGALGALLEFGQPMGVILRCPTCELAVIRIVRTPGMLRIDFSGIRLLAIPEGDELHGVAGFSRT